MINWVDGDDTTHWQIDLDDFGIMQTELETERTYAMIGSVADDTMGSGAGENCDGFTSSAEAYVSAVDLSSNNMFLEPTISCDNTAMGAEDFAIICISY
jgi:hypothetical protein